MAAAELAFEVMSGALEVTHGTPVTPPDHIFNLVGTLTPTETRSRRTQSDGSLVEFRRSVRTRMIGAFAASGDLDVNMLPFFLEMAVKGGGTHALSPGGTLAHLHTYIPTVNSDDLKSATFYAGDPNNQVFQGAYGMIDEITIANDATSTDGATFTVSGTCQNPQEVAPPVQPAFQTASLLAGQFMQLWLDTGSTAIGTTSINGRLISSTTTIPTGVVYKYFAKGTVADLSFTRHGRAKRHATTTIVLELTDMAQYDLFQAGTPVKARIRHYGDPVIETTLRPYVSIDTYGPLSNLTWQDLEGANRTVSFEIQSELNTTLGADFIVSVQNSLVAL